MAEAEPAGTVRFLDILTTASTIARSLGASSVEAAHLLDAIAVLCGEVVASDVSGPVSPLARPGGALDVDEAARALTQRWFAQLGNVAAAELTESQLEQLRGELSALANEAAS